MGNLIQFPTPLPSLTQPQDVGLYTDEINQIIRYINTIVYGNNVPATVLLKANNLSDVNSVLTARANLGLGSAAVLSSTAFDAAGAAAAVQTASLQKSNNLSDIGNAASARGNLGLGSAATQSTTVFDAAGAAAARAAKGINGDITALTALSVKSITTGNYTVRAGDQYLVVYATTASKTISYTSTASSGQINVIKADTSYNQVLITNGTTSGPTYGMSSPAVNGDCQSIVVLKTTAGLKFI